MRRSCSRHESARTACIGEAAMGRVPPAWPRGSQPTRSTSMGRGLWQAAGWHAPIGGLRLPSRVPSMAGSRSMRATSRSRAVTRRRRPTREDSYLRSRRRLDVVDLEECSGLALEGSTLASEARSMRACVASTRRRRPRSKATRRSRSPVRGRAACWSPPVRPFATSSGQRKRRDRIAEFAERCNGSRYMLAFCRFEYGEIARSRGPPAQAETMLEAALEDFSTPGRPGRRRRSSAWQSCGEGRGEPREAATLLARAGPSPSAVLCRAPTRTRPAGYIACGRPRGEGPPAGAR